MTRTQNPLASAEEFARYCDSVRCRLSEHVQSRAEFLSVARERLGALERVAREADASALCSELRELLGLVESELHHLQSSGISGRSADGMGPVDTQHAVVAATPVHPHENGASDTSSDGRARVRQPAVPEAHPVRPLEDVYRDVEAMTHLLDDAGRRWPGSSGLIRLKALLARQRGLQAELTGRGIDHWPLRQIMHNIRRRIDEEHGSGHYLIGLRAELWPSDPWPWVRLAELYEDLADAVEAMAWYTRECERLTRPDRHELLESIAAFQTRLWRHLQSFFPRQNDEHQIHLFRELCSVAAQEDVYLFSLQERCSDELLAEKVDHLHILLEHLRLDRAGRPARDAALQELRTLLREPDFGRGADDAVRLQAAVEHCLSEGVPPDSAAFRRWLPAHRQLVSRMSGETADMLVTLLDGSPAITA
jgi:hypothetical protein